MGQLRIAILESAYVSTRSQCIGVSLGFRRETAAPRERRNSNDSALLVVHTQNGIFELRLRALQR
jgi:hypothetical protein